MLQPKTQESSEEGQTVEVEEASVEEKSSGVVEEKDEIPLQSPVHEVSNHADSPSKEESVSSEKPDGQQIPAEVEKRVEQAVDTLFRPFWEWNKAAEARGLSPVDKLAEYTQSDFFKNNYEIRERHREAVVSDILRRYPQCGPIKEKVTMYYNTLFAKRMIAVNNVVVGWQKAAR